MEVIRKIGFPKKAWSCWTVWNIYIIIHTWWRSVDKGANEILEVNLCERKDYKWPMWIGDYTGSCENHEGISLLSIVSIQFGSIALLLFTFSVQDKSYDAVHVPQTNKLYLSLSESGFQHSRPCNSAAIPFIERCATDVLSTYPIYAFEQPKPSSRL